MKPSEFKQILKPLIKQTIKEVLFEEGVLSKVVSEVALGMSAPLTEQKSNISRRIEEEHRERRREEKEELYEMQRKERIRRLNESSHLGTNVFSGTSPIPDSNAAGPNALSGVPSTDAGVDISDIEKLANGKWKHLI